MGKQLTELRSLLSATTRELGNKGATSKEIVAAFKKKYPKEIADVIDRLTDIALTKLISDVSNRRPSGIAATQLELFSEYTLPDMIIVRETTPEGPRVLHKTVAKATFAEAQQYLDDHSKPKTSDTHRRRELRRLLKDLKPFKRSDSSTIEECWRAAQKGKKQVI